MDIWSGEIDTICITTNGDVRRDGAAVMGRGVALQAKQRLPGIEYKLGDHIRSHGNHVCCIGSLIFFPVKHHWKNKANLQLIKRSAEELVALLKISTFIDTVALPRPGCGNGGLDWKDVKEIIAPILPDCVVVVTNI